MVGWLRPVERVSHLAVAERSVETSGLARSEGCEDLGPEASSFPVTEGAGRSIRSGRVVNGIGVGWGGIGPPGNGRVGRPDGDAIGYVARSAIPAGGKTAHLDETAGKVGAMTALAKCKTAVRPRLRFRRFAMEGRVSPPGGVCMTGLAVLQGCETAHPGDAAALVVAVTSRALAWIAYKSSPVVHDPVGGVLSRSIKNWGISVHIAAAPNQNRPYQQPYTLDIYFPHDHTFRIYLALCTYCDGTQVYQEGFGWQIR
jgi:hypothetical protein